MLNMRRGLTPFLKLIRNNKIHVATWEEPWGSRLNSRWGPIPLKQLERNPEPPNATWKEAWLPWGNMRGSLMSPSQLEWNQIFPLQLKKNIETTPSVRAEAWFSSSDSRAIEHSPSQLESRLDFPEEHSRFPESHVAIKKTPTFCHNYRKTTRFPIQGEMTPFPLQYLRSHPEFPLVTWKKAWLSSFNSTGSTSYPSALERIPKFPATTQEEPRVPHLLLRWGPIPLLRLQRNADLPLALKRRPVSPIETWEVPHDSCGK